MSDDHETNPQNVSGSVVATKYAPSSGIEFFKRHVSGDVVVARVSKVQICTDASTTCAVFRQGTGLEGKRYCTALQ